MIPKCNSHWQNFHSLKSSYFNRNVIYDDHYFWKLESLDSVLDQNKNSYPVEDDTASPAPLLSYHNFGQHPFNDVQRRSIDRLLSCYILYNKNYFERKMPFLEFWHSQNCSGVCSCESNSMVLFHFITCGSSYCSTCAPAVRTHGTDFGDIVNFNMSGDLPFPAKCRRLNTYSMRRDSSCDDLRLPVDSIGLSGPLNDESGSPVIVTSDNPEVIHFEDEMSDNTVSVTVEYDWNPIQCSECS